MVLVLITDRDLFAIAGLIIGVTITILLWRYARRNHVWIELDLDSGPSIRKLIKPGPNGAVELEEHGTYFVEPYHFATFKRRPLFRFKEGDPRPWRFQYSQTVTKVETDNPGEKVVGVKETYQPFPAPIDAKLYGTFFRQRVYQQIYSGRLGGILVLAGIAVVALLVVISFFV